MTNNTRTIEVVEYDEKWNEIYLAEAKKIKINSNNSNEFDCNIL